jgi:hypothetical protein
VHGERVKILKPLLMTDPLGEKRDIRVNGRVGLLPDSDIASDLGLFSPGNAFVVYDPMSRIG